jgi:uncharacterized SAM-binding protein YcdF (DUF218 family)
MTCADRSARKFWGIFKRKERWGLTWRGWLLGVAIAATAVCLLVLNVYSFLSVTHRVDANILVVEGWVLPFVITAGVEEFNTGSYDRIFTTGGPVTGIGGFVNDFQTDASVGASRLRAAGVPNGAVQMVPSRVNDRDRTYSSAVALRRWVEEHNDKIRGINIVTETTHARRTRALFQKAFGKKMAIGVIAVRNPDYDPDHWWRTSQGVRDVMGEAVAYVYALCLFHPSTEPTRRFD